MRGWFLIYCAPSLVALSVKRVAIAVWTGPIAFLARHRPTVMALLSLFVGTTSSLAIVHPASNWPFLLGAAVGIVLIVYVGQIDSRFARAQLVAFMLPAIHRVLELGIGDRITVHFMIQGLRGPRYQQLTDYFPQQMNPGQGRVFPISYGIAAQALQTVTPQCWTIPPGKDFGAAMIERWTMDKVQLATLNSSRRSFLAYPIGQQGVLARAVLYMDSDDPNRFTDNSKDTYYRKIREIFLPQLTEALRTAH